MEAGPVAGSIAATGVQHLGGFSAALQLALALQAVADLPLLLLASVLAPHHA